MISKLINLGHRIDRTLGKVAQKFSQWLDQEPPPEELTPETSLALIEERLAKIETRLESHEFRIDYANQQMINLSNRPQPQVRIEHPETIRRPGYIKP